MAVGICLVIAFGVNLEHRTALRRVPMTDLGVFAIASTAVWSGENPYSITDWHGWHYQYPPALAILFLPLAEPIPPGRPVLHPGEQRTEANTPWGYEIKGGKVYGRGVYFYDLNDQNRHFFWVVGIWYILSLLFIFGSAHAVACTLEGRGLREPPPVDGVSRGRWWRLRLWPLLACSGVLGTDLSRGQVDTLMLVVIALGLYLAARGSGFKAGICLAFPATVKLFPPFLLIYPFWRRQWRMAAGVVTGLLLFLLVLPVVTLGPNRSLELCKVWVEVLAKPALGKGTDTSRLSELTGMNSTDNQSLLSAVHSLRYLNLPPKQRPQFAAQWERNLVYIVGAAMLVGIGLVAGIRRRDSPRELVVIAGMLVGLSLVVSPTVHCYYHLLMLPLVAALVDPGLASRQGQQTRWKWLVPVILFTLTDAMAQLPIVGQWLQACGVPLWGLICLMAAGAMVLIKRPDVEIPAAVCAAMPSP